MFEVAVRVADAPVPGSSNGFLFRECQELIAVILILLTSSGYFSRQAGGQIVAQRVKAVEDIDDALLFGERRDWYYE